MGSYYHRNRWFCFSFRSGSRVPALISLLLVAGGCVLAYRYFFQRQGEAAANLIPADAAIVVTLDLKPSPEQVPTFRRIHNALQRERIEGQFDSLLTTLLSNSPIGTDLRPFVTHSLAYAALKADGPGSPAKFASVGLFAVSDAGRVRDILARDAAKTTQDRLDYYQVKPGDNTYLTVVSDYLVVANEPSALIRIVKVHRGDALAVTSLPAYQHARQTLPADANLMLFIASESVQQAATTLGGLQRHSPLSSVPWVAIGMSARANGIDTYLQAPIEAPANGDLSRITPLDMRLLKRLPGGAYGLLAFSQPGKYWSRLQTFGTSTVPLLGGDSRQTSRDIDAGLARFERETGMSMPRDVLPDLYGHAVLAIYPAAAGSNDKDLDGLILLDDASGADPAALADRVRAYIQRQSAARDRTALRFTSSNRDTATLWTLGTGTPEPPRNTVSAAGDGAQKRLLQPGGMATTGTRNFVTMSRAEGTSQTASPVVETKVVSNPDGSAVITERHADGTNQMIMRAAGSPTQSEAPSRMRVDSDVVVGSRIRAATNPVRLGLSNKELIYAQVGRSVLIASSRHMMDRALDAYLHGLGAMADDPAYAWMSNHAPVGTQSLLMVDLPGIMQAIRTQLENSLRDSHSGVTADDVVRMFGQNSGIVGAQQYDGSVIKCYLFLPVNYERVIRLIGAARHANPGNAAFGAPTAALAAPATANASNQ